MSTWFAGISSNAQAALIGAAASLAVVLAKDFFLHLYLAKRQDAKTLDAIYKRYSEPLASASVSAMWRFHEIFSRDGRASFLTAGPSKTAFEEYKLRSTYFRLSALLGWIRALRREISILRLEGGGRALEIDGALHDFEQALADGHHVELQRLEGLRTLWQFPKIDDAPKRRRLAVAVETKIKQILLTEGFASAVDVAPARQFELVRVIAQMIAADSPGASVVDEVIRETLARAIQQIAVREAWLYRDWQAAIGDLMVKEISGASRRFEVLGYGEFESIALV